MSEKQIKKNKWSRRAFIITGSVLGGGLVVGVGGLSYVNKKIAEYSGIGFDGEMINAWISISPENKITIAVPRAEMGQGVYTSVPMLISEELEVDVETVEVYHPQPDSPYANTALLTSQPRDIYKGLSMMEKMASFIPVVATGGSTTIMDGYDNMRMAGAQAREMLISAAAKKWGINRELCKAEKGQIINSQTKETLNYGALASLAANEKLDKLPTLKSAKEFKIIGKSIRRLDIPSKVTGEAIFGLDVKPDNLHYAAIKHPSIIGGKIVGIKNASDIESLAGVKKLIYNENGAVVIANNTWRAKNAALAIELDENSNGNESLSSESINELMDKLLDEKALSTPEKEGDCLAVFNKSEKLIESTYDVPYLAHACMEPMNCTIRIDDDKAEVWVGHQAPSIVQSVINEVTGIDKSSILINTTYLGGGFGRRSEKDFIEMAAFTAQQMKGIPVQLVYTREEDMTNDMYRPTVKSRFKAVVNPSGAIEAWDNKIALQSVAHSSMNRIMPAMATKPKDDITSVEGAAHLPYHMETRQVAFNQAELPIQVGFWRSVGSSQNGFFTESFMDECAHHVGIDPFLFRKEKLKDHPRFEAVLDRVAEIASWGAPLSENTFRGIALHKSFGSIVGQVAEIIRTGEKEFKIDKYYCVIDCGRIVNPDTILAQMESGIIFGLSATLYGEITFENGKVKQKNFPDYEMVRMKVSPKIEVAIMDIDEYPGGVGEPGTPPAAPALTNAIFAATGERVRSLPLAKHGYSFV